jgi:hypothetical protein
MSLCFRPEGAENVARIPTAASERAPVSSLEAGRTKGKKLNPIVVKEMKGRQSEIEEEIIRCETEIRETEMALGNFKSTEETIRLTKLLECSRERLGSLMGQWEGLSLALEQQTALQ